MYRLIQKKYYIKTNFIFIKKTILKVENLSILNASKVDYRHKNKKRIYR